MSIGKPNLKTFCPAPWFQIRNFNDGRKSPCCKITQTDPRSVDQSPKEYLSSEEIVSLKKDLHQGIRAKECSRCWVEEDLGFKSLRQHLLTTLTHGKNINNSWMGSYFKRKEDFSTDIIAAADIKIGNTCNFNCIMCKPEDSSQIYNDWIKRQDSEFVKEKLETDKDYFEKLKNLGYKNKSYRQYLDDVFAENRNIQWLRLLGGEPLLDKKLLQKIKELPNERKNKIKLSFTTNGSVNLKQTLDYIDGKLFDHIHFNISVEGIKEVQEYARYGSDWSQIEKNILQVKDAYKNIQCNLSYVIQTPTILRIKDLLSWAEQNNFYFSVSPCYEPDYLSLKTLPNQLRDSLKNSLIEFTDVIRQDPSIDEDNNHISSKQFIEMLDDKEWSFDQTLFEKYKRYIKWYEANKNIPRLSEIIPEWKDYLK